MREAIGIIAIAALVMLFVGCQARAERQGAADSHQSAACGAGQWVSESGECVVASEAFTAQEGRTFWVDQRALIASDANPGTREAPWRTIGRAAETLRPGDAVLIRTGVYRESIQPRVGGKSGQHITYAAYPGDTVVVSGADLLGEGWSRVGNLWKTAWPGPALPAHADGSRHFRRELVVADGALLRPAVSRERLLPNTFFVTGTDTAPESLFVRLRGASDNPVIEIATATYLFRPRGEKPEPECGALDTPGYFRVVGIHFRHAANRAQWGAVCSGSRGSVLENVLVEETNGLGIATGGTDHVFLHTASNRNGQMGWGGSCERCLFEDTESANNNWKGHNPAWEAGGGKWHHTRETVWRRHNAVGNAGPGIWLDGYNVRNTIEASTLVRNALAGIMLELETRYTLVQHNYIEETQFQHYAGAGVLSQAASHNAFVHNTVVGNEATGLWLRLDPAGRAEDGHNRVFNNVIVGNLVTDAEEAREITVAGRDASHVRTNQFGGNVYGQHAANHARASTFFLLPDSASGPADFRSGDLVRWQELTSELNASLVPAELVDQFRIPDTQWLSLAHPLPELPAYGAHSAPAEDGRKPGANLMLLGNSF